MGNRHLQLFYIRIRRLVDVIRPSHLVLNVSAWSSPTSITKSKLAWSTPVWSAEVILRSIVDGCTSGGAKDTRFFGFKRTWVTRVTGFWHNPGLQMTKTELQSALAAATQTDKRTAGVFLDTLSALAYKEIKRNGEFVLPGFGKLVKQKRKARTGFNPKTQQKIKIPRFFGVMIGRSTRPSSRVQMIR